MRYTPLGPEPGFCSSPGHGDRPARDYPGGRLCPECAEAAAAATVIAARRRLSGIRMSPLAIVTAEKRPSAGV